MKHVRKDITGQRFGKLVALSFVAHKTRGSNNQSKWLCRCDCGTEKAIFRSSLLKGASTSCGCSTRTANGEASRSRKTPEYQAWLGMSKRCENRKSRSWPHYGGRGITVCDRWRNSYAAFLADVGRRPSSRHSLDRINVNGNYEPDNVRWASSQEQIRNRRPFQSKGWRQSAKHAWGIVRDFERVIASYTGAPYAVAVDSCTNALMLAVAYHVGGFTFPQAVGIPKFTYVGVPMSVRNAGATVVFRDEPWVGKYQLNPFPVYDAARHFTSAMYIPGSMMCLSFHWTKHLAIGHGGAILCDDKSAVAWLKRARYDGRAEGVSPKSDKFPIVGWHAVMSPVSAAQGLLLMAGMAEHNEPLPWGPGTTSDYPDLSEMEIFR